LFGQDVGVGVSRGGVDADDGVGELIDTEGLLIQVLLQAAEGGTSAKSAQPVGEAVVVGTSGEDGFAQEGREGVPVLSDPRL
jgi:hypothetical protein